MDEIYSSSLLCMGTNLEFKFLSQDEVVLLYNFKCNIKAGLDYAENIARLLDFLI